MKVICVYDLPPPQHRSALGCYLTRDGGKGDRGKQQGGSGQVRVVPNTKGPESADEPGMDTQCPQWPQVRVARQRGTLV